MATITVNITVAKTLATLDAATIKAILDWIDANIRQKLPADASLSVTLQIIP